MSHNKFHKEARVTFTTTLPVDFLHELQQLSEETGLRRNVIVERAFYLWNEAREEKIKQDQLQIIEM